LTTRAYPSESISSSNRSDGTDTRWSADGSGARS
jgi:hypothetical protein